MDNGHHSSASNLGKVGSLLASRDAGTSNSVLTLPKKKEATKITIIHTKKKKQPEEEKKK